MTSEGGTAPLCNPMTSKGGTAPLCNPRQHLGEILVASPGKDQDVDALAGVGEKPRERMRWLERRDDPLQLGQTPKGFQGVLVGDSLVGDPALVTQPGALGVGRPRLPGLGPRTRLAA